MFLDLFRPKSGFNPGQMVSLPPGPRGGVYLLIKERRWTQPTNERKKQWVYDGYILEFIRGELMCTTYLYTASPENFGFVPGLDYF